MFWWLTHGFPQSGMPGFTAEMTEQDRWDVVNFLRAFSEGFQARILTPYIAAEKPWLGAPNFYFEGAAGEPLELKTFRERAPCFSSSRPSRGRRRGARPGIGAGRGPARSRVRFSSSPKTRRRTKGSDPYPGKCREIRNLRRLSRTVANRSDGISLGMSRRQMEFLIDRFGYIRARWIAEEEPEGWQSLERLRQQAERLNREPRIRPPPDDHVH
jgi:putative copper resistance protein D